MLANQSVSHVCHVACVLCAIETNWFFQNEACMLVHPIILALTKQEDGEFPVWPVTYSFSKQTTSALEASHVVLKSLHSRG